MGSRAPVVFSRREWQGRPVWCNLHTKPGAFERNCGAFQASHAVSLAAVEQTGGMCGSAHVAAITTGRAGWAARSAVAALLTVLVALQVPHRAALGEFRSCNGRPAFAMAQHAGGPGIVLSVRGPSHGEIVRRASCPEAPLSPWQKRS